MPCLLPCWVTSGILQGLSRSRAPLTPFGDPAPRLDFYFGLALGTLLGIAPAGALLDLIYLARQHLTISLRNRLASLTLSRNRCA